MSQLHRNEDVQGVAALSFVKVKEYTTFDAEFTLKEGDLVIHFFPPNDKPLNRNYWETIFPSCLERISKTTFNLDYPELMAQYIDDRSIGVEKSWWFKAEGIGALLDPHKKTYTFLDALDAALDAVSSM